MKLQLHEVRSRVSGVVEILSAEVSRSSLPSWGPPERPEGPARFCGSWSFLTRGMQLLPQAVGDLPPETLGPRQVAVVGTRAA